MQKQMMERIAVLLLMSYIGHFFVRSTLEEYLTRRTSFHVTTEPIDNTIHPTMTLCFTLPYLELSYGPEPHHDFDLFAYKSNTPSFMKAVHEGPNEFWLNAAEVLTFNLTVLNVLATEIYQSHDIYEYKHCLKMTPGSVGISDIIFELGFHSKKYLSYMSEVTIHFTSEENSYGVMLRQGFTFMQTLFVPKINVQLFSDSHPSFKIC